MKSALAAYKTGLVDAKKLESFEAINTHCTYVPSIRYDVLVDIRLDHKFSAENAMFYYKYKELFEKVKIYNIKSFFIAYRCRHQIITTMALCDPNNWAWQRELSVSHERRGDIFTAGGDHGAARSSYLSALRIAEDLARRDPSNVEWQRDLIVSNVKLGEVATAQGDGATAAGCYRAALDVAERLAAAGRLAAGDAWIPDDLRRRLDGLGG
jgi:tetratricopeptide (TPR) repeat protein